MSLVLKIMSLRCWQSNKTGSSKRHTQLGPNPAVGQIDQPVSSAKVNEIRAPAAHIRTQYIDVCIGMHATDDAGHQSVCVYVRVPSKQVMYSAPRVRNSLSCSWTNKSPSSSHFRFDCSFLFFLSSSSFRWKTLADSSFDSILTRHDWLIDRQSPPALHRSNYIWPPRPRVV